MPDLTTAKELIDASYVKKIEALDAFIKECGYDRLYPGECLAVRREKTIQYNRLLLKIEDLKQEWRNELSMLKKSNRRAG